MSFFSFPPDQVLTPCSVDTPTMPVGGSVKVARGADGGERLLATSGATVDPTQFRVFQFSSKVKGPPLLESSQVEPKIDGSPEEPDVLVALEMLSFHTGLSERVNLETRATVRITVGKDESSTDKQFDTVFWSIAAGLKLYDEAKNDRSDAKELKSDLHKAFGNRPIEVPGGLARLSFEVVKHKEPEWWQRIFKFMRSGTGQSLVSVLGFPAITQQAIGVLDELLNKVAGNETQPLFKSLPMRLALSKYAREAFVGGSPRVRIGALTQGFCVLARGQDFNALNEANVLYYPTYGRLVPAGVNESDLMTGNYDDPLQDVTYAVFRVGTRGTKLDPTFNFSS
jgi:hypothetical protein